MVLNWTSLLCDSFSFLPQEVDIEGRVRLVMESALTARDRVGVQDFVLLENHNSEAAFIENLRRRFRENLIYVMQPVFSKIFLQNKCSWCAEIWMRFLVWLRRTLAQCWCQWTLTKSWRFTPNSRWSATEESASMRYRHTCELPHTPLDISPCNSFTVNSWYEIK